MASEQRSEATLNDSASRFVVPCTGVLDYVLSPAAICGEDGTELQKPCQKLVPGGPAGKVST